MRGEWESAERGLAPPALDRAASALDQALPAMGWARTGLDACGDGASAGGEKIHAVVHCMTPCCFGWDYRQRAIYMITLVQRERREPLLGRLQTRFGMGLWSS